MTETPSSPEGRGSTYWYDGDDSAVALLSALRSFRMADQELRRRMSEGMDMNTTDLAALRRAPHPLDGRSRIVEATDHAHSQVRERLSRMHERMLEIAQQVPEESRIAAIAFLHAMGEQLDAEAAPPQLTPPED